MTIWGPPPAPRATAPLQDAGEEDDEDLVCARCGTRPRQATMAWSSSHGALLHLGVIGTFQSRLRRVCGGVVVRPGDVSRYTYSPGAYALCMPGRNSLTVHVVRLGRRLDARNDAWSGTPLCGRRYKGVVRWLPVQPFRAEAVTCAGCREAMDAEAQ